ncbi:MAG: Os1348 family NHLP clan protein [Candidatus Eisenbacteria bacterium]|nr:Franean1_4349 family RiPP [Candidatus Eisenbacteria bacterium]
MSHSTVERVIGWLATDEAFRRRFSKDPGAALQELVERGFQLTPCELHALQSIDSRRLARFAEALDPRLQKTDLQGGV